MNDLILQEKVLKNKSFMARFHLYALPIGWSMAYLMLRFLIHFTNIEFAAAPQSGRFFIFYSYLVFIGSTFSFFYSEINLRKSINAIKVQEGGVSILGPFGQEQIVRWDEISTIKKHTSQKNVILQKEWNIYKVQTTIPGKFSLRKKSGFYFYISYSHQNHKELLALRQNELESPRL